MPSQGNASVRLSPDATAAIINDESLSITARGIVLYLLHQEAEARENVRELADNHLGLGRTAIATAVKELTRRGYYVVRKVRDRRTGQIRSQRAIFSVPLAVAPVPVNLPPGDSGTSPHTRTHAAATSSPAAAFPPASLSVDLLPVQAETNPSRPPKTPARAKSRATASREASPEADFLARVIRCEPKLALSAAELQALAVHAAPWLDAGVDEAQARRLLTDGLPEPVWSPAGLLQNRLLRKLPPPRMTAPPPRVECGDCRRPLPAGQDSGICAPCTGATPAPPPRPSTTATVASKVATLRDLARGGRPDAAGAG